MSFAELAQAQAEVCASTFGEIATLTDNDGDSATVRAVVDAQTRVLGQFGDNLDPRPSALFLRSEVGDRPRGQLEVEDTVYNLGKIADGEDGGDAHFVRVWLSAEADE